MNSNRAEHGHNKQPEHILKILNTTNTIGEKIVELRLFKVQSIKIYYIVNSLLSGGHLIGEISRPG